MIQDLLDRHGYVSVGTLQAESGCTYNESYEALNSFYVEMDEGEYTTHFLVNFQNKKLIVEENELNHIIDEYNEINVHVFCIGQPDEINYY
jgi:hypothetical protein